MNPSLILYKMLEKRASLKKTAKPWLNEKDFVKLCKKVRDSKKARK